MLKCKNVFLLFLLISGLMLLSVCKNIFGPKDPDDPYEPPEPKYVVVEVKYQRIYDNLDVCPTIHAGNPFYDEGVYLEGFIGKNPKMEKIGEDLFYVELLERKCRVNYPLSDYKAVDPYNVYVLDGVWFDISNQGTGCNFRVHDMWFNGYLAPRSKIHKLGNREYLLVRFDEDSVPHFE